MRGGKREGSGRKVIGKKKNITLTMPEELWEAFERTCNKKGKKQAELIRELIEIAI